VKADPLPDHHGRCVSFGYYAAVDREDVLHTGPHGIGHGTKLLQEWAARANIRLAPLRVFYRDDTVITQQEAGWRSADTGLVTGGQAVASVFIVCDGQVPSVVRYDELKDALRKANLDESTEVQAD
jgi:hypothetical protein